MNKIVFYIIGFGVLMVLDTLTQISFKFTSIHAGKITLSLNWLTQVFHTPWLYVAILGYLGSFITWMTLLKHSPVGPAFAASHLSIVSVLIASVIIFGDKLNYAQILGAGFIVGGIIFLSLSKASSHEQI